MQAEQGSCTGWYAFAGQQAYVQSLAIGRQAAKLAVEVTLLVGQQAVIPAHHKVHQRVEVAEVIIRSQFDRIGHGVK
mgnify:CR=1 FL=1